MTTLLASSQRVWGKYVTAKGVEYSISCKASFVGQTDAAAKLGYAPATAGLPNIPNGFRPRKVKMTAVGQPARYVICYTEAATLWTGEATTIDIFSHGNDVTYTLSDGALGEKAERNMATRSA